MRKYSSEVLDVVQAGFEDESTPGTPVAATFRFHSMKFDLKYNYPTEDVMQAGNLYPVDESPGKPSTAVTAKGIGSVQDIIMALSAQVCLPGFANVSGSVYDATFAPFSLVDNAKKTLTLQKGQSGSGLANVVPGVGGTDFELDFAPQKAAQYTGKMIGRERIPAQTLTPSINQLSRSVLNGVKFDAYIATSEAGLSGGILAPPYAPLKCKIKHNKTQSEVYSLNSGESSFDDLTADAPDLEYALTFARNAASEDYIDSILRSDLYYLMLVNQGSLIESGLYHQIVVTSPIKFKTPDEGTDQKVMTISLVARAMHDDTFNATGGALKIVCRSTLVSLP